MPGGKVVFYKHIIGGPDMESYACCFLKRTFSGWKLIDGGEHSGNIRSQFFPATADTPFPLFYGEVSDTKVTKIKILEKQRNVYFPAKLITSGNIKLWYLFTKNALGSKFEILGFSNEDIVLTTDSMDISPLQAEQNQSINGLE